MSRPCGLVRTLLRDQVQVLGRDDPDVQPRHLAVLRGPVLLEIPCELGRGVGLKLSASQIGLLLVLLSRLSSSKSSR